MLVKKPFPSTAFSHKSESWSMSESRQDYDQAGKESVESVINVPVLYSTWYMLCVLYDGIQSLSSHLIYGASCRSHPSGPMLNKEGKGLRKSLYKSFDGRIAMGPLRYGHGLHGNAKQKFPRSIKTGKTPRASNESRAQTPRHLLHACHATSKNISALCSMAT